MSSGRGKSDSLKRIEKAITKKKKRRLADKIKSNENITDETKAEVLGLLSRTKGTNRAKKLFNQARSGGTSKFRERQRLERTRTLLSDKPGSRGLFG